jgi:SAM-dependent methyltransferase
MVPRAMTEDLAEYVGGAPARFVPEEMRGELVEAEHLARYRWAAQLTSGKRVLDAGCGVGYGSVILAESGADEVLGVDLGEAVVAAASAAERPGLQFKQGDIAHLDTPDGSFDAVVCFEVIEHVENPQAVLAEFARVLAPRGLLVISSPNRDTYVPGNPHHHKEFTPDELSAALSELWSNARLVRQHNWIGSGVFEDELAGTADRLVEGIQVHKVAAEAPGGEPYTLALASDGPLPAPPPVLALTGVTEMRRWLEHYDQQQRILNEQRQAITVQDAQNAELDRLRRRLIEVETELASYVDVDPDSTEGRRLRHELEIVSQSLHDVLGSPSWRLTAPLRAAKRIVKRFRG